MRFWSRTRTLAAREVAIQKRSHSEAGFSLMEALVAATIAVIAVVGMAHSFGLGRAFVNRYEVARVALGAATARMEALSVLAPDQPEFSFGLHPTPLDVFYLHGAPAGTIEWRVEPFDDPITPGITIDLKRVVTVVRWGTGADADSVRLSRLVPQG